jgi:hypothetical protein
MSQSESSPSLTSSASNRTDGKKHSRIWSKFSEGNNEEGAKVMRCNECKKVCHFYNLSFCLKRLVPLFFLELQVSVDSDRSEKALGQTAFIYFMALITTHGYLG